MIYTQVNVLREALQKVERPDSLLQVCSFLIIATIQFSFLFGEMHLPGFQFEET